MKLSVKVENQTFAVEIKNPNQNPMIVNVDGTEFSVCADENATVTAVPTAPVAKKQTAAAGNVEVKAPIPGVIQEINVKEGQSVKKGDVLFVLEAMKMKNNIIAPQNGSIASINISKGDTVTHGQVLLTIAG